MTEEINVMELLEKSYMKIFAAAIKNKYNDMTMKGSGLKFRIREGNKITHERFAWKLEFDRSIDFGYGNWKVFYFDSDRALGKFLFECGINNGLPKGAKCIIERKC